MRDAARRVEPRAASSRSPGRGRRGGRDLPPPRVRQPGARAAASASSCAASARRSRSRSRTRSPASGASTSGRRPRSLNAYVAPRSSSATSRRSRRELAGRGMAGTAPRDAVERRDHDARATARAQPVQTLLSGPVGGTIGGAALVAARPAAPNLLCVDMGGTSFDPSLVVDGEADRLDRDRARGAAGADAAGRHPHDRRRRRLARLARGGRPARRARRARAPIPGPACYGRGGTEPTVTDANLVLGRLDPGPSSAAG